MGQLRFAPHGLIVLPDDFNEVEKCIPVENLYVYKMSSGERKQLAAAILVAATDYTTLGEIANLFSVSRATILNDFDGIKEIILTAGLELESKPSRGVLVTGAESNRRIFLADFLSKDVPAVDQWYSLTNRGEMRTQSTIICKILNERCHAEGFTLPDGPFKKTLSLLSICVQRNKEGNRLESFGGGVFRGYTHDDIGSYERTVIELIGQYCSVSMGEDEELFFTERIKTMRLNRFNQFGADDLRVKKLARLFTKGVSKEIGIDLNADYDLFEFLSSHLESMFTSEPSHFPENPALDEVLDGQPEVLNAVRDNLDPIERHAGRPISPIEVKYLALHICAALERRMNSASYLPRVIVVCNGGVGASQLLAEELRGHFDIEIAKVMPSHEVPYIEFYGADLVISTVPLDACPVEHLVVHLPLKDREFGIIHKKLDSLASRGYRAAAGEPTINASGLLKRLEPIVAQAEGEDGTLMDGIRIEVRRYFHEAQHIESQLLSPYLHQLLLPNHIMLDVECTDWKDAIRIASRVLLNLGCIEDRYVQAMISSVERYGPYDVLAPGFAVPHASPDEGAVKVGMSLIRLTHPVNLADDPEMPVSFFCVLSAVDAKTHLRAFANLLDMISLPDNAFLDALDKAETSREAASLIKSYEYQLVSS